MTAFEIATALIEMGKDFCAAEVREVIEGKARICDFAEIEALVMPHASSNEMNAARFAINLMDGVAA